MKRSGPDAGCRAFEEEDEIVPRKTTRNVLLVLSHCHLELQIHAVPVASCAKVSSQPSSGFWVASVALDWLGERIFVRCMKNLFPYC
jgi:hypothetical protein